MPFNGSGTFSRIYSWATDAANGLFVDSTRMDTDTNDIATGLSDCITRDGQSVPTANLPMGGFKLTGLGVGTSDNDSARVSNANAKGTCEGRLTLTSGTPVTTADVTAATTLYFTPYNGNRISLYDGTNWLMRTFTELTVDVTVLAVSKMYDVFIYDNAGTPAIEILAWTNDTTRATALAFQDGVYVKSGTTTRRYIGSFRTNASTRANDSYALRHVWNYCNRILRPMRVTEATATWTYTTATFRAANNANNILDFVVGVSEDAVIAEVQAFASNTGGNADVSVAIGLDSTTTSATGCLISSGSTQVVNRYMGLQAQLATIPPVGRHFLAWLEYSQATGTTTWGGTAAYVWQSGIHGWIRA